MRLEDGSVFLLVNEQHEPVAASPDLAALRAAGRLLGIDLCFWQPGPDTGPYNVLREFRACGCTVRLPSPRA